MWLQITDKLHGHNWVNLEQLLCIRFVQESGTPAALLYWPQTHLTTEDAGEIAVLKRWVEKQQHQE